MSRYQLNCLACVAVSGLVCGVLWRFYLRQWGVL